MIFKSYLFSCLLVFFIACAGNEKDNTITGTWEYEKLEHVSGNEEYLLDSAVMEAHERNNGLTFTFGDDQTYAVTKRNPGKPDELISKGTFVFSKDKNLLLTKTTDGTTGQLQVIELSGKILKINTLPTSEEYIVLKKNN